MKINILLSNHEYTLIFTNSKKKELVTYDNCTCRRPVPVNRLVKIRANSW